MRHYKVTIIWDDQCSPIL